MNFRLFEVQATLILEIITRGLLSIIFLELEHASPFVRKINSEELWLYRNPRTPDYVPSTTLWPMVFMVPTVVIVLYCAIKKDKVDLGQALLAFTLALGLNGVITNVVKLIVGRPRPDFFYRCFPDGKATLDNIEDISLACTGEIQAIEEGRKSFPSGHSSFSFCSLGFLSLWSFGKLQVFSKSVGEGWRLVVGLLPLILALVVALSRTCDYHHHWQDVLIGSSLGLFIAYLCYRQYYPRLGSMYSHLSYIKLPLLPYAVENQQNGGPKLLSKGMSFEDEIKYI